jgi:hypothetical protein
MVKEWKVPANEEGAMEMWKSAVITDKDGKKVRQAWDCPKCGAVVQKDGGCLHFTHSAPQGCGHQFCWSCLKPWPCAKTYQCNDAPEEDNKVPAYLLDKGIDKAKVFRWAFEKFMLMDDYVLESRKLGDKVLKEEGGGGAMLGPWPPPPVIPSPPPPCPWRPSRPTSRTWAWGAP